MFYTGTKFDYAAIVWRLFVINSMWPGDVLQRYTIGLLLVQACRLLASSHYLKERWLIVNSLEIQYPRKVRHGPHWAHVPYYTQHQLLPLGGINK